jgi:hypothetical protein
MSASFSGIRSMALVVVVGAGLSLTACDNTTPAPADEQTASGAPTTSSVPSSGSSSAPSAPRVEPTPASSAAPAANLEVPVLPAEAEEESEEGFEAFTAHWLDLLSYSYEANDLEPLQAVSDPACTFCADAGTAMTQIYQMGWAVGGATTLTNFTTDFAPDAAGTYTADITTTQAEIFYFSGEGWLGSSESRPDTPHTVTARHTGDGWQLIDYTTPAVSEVPAG